MTRTDEEILHAARHMGMLLRNSIFSWVDHPTFQYKTDLQRSAVFLVGAYELMRNLGVSFDWEERAAVLDLEEHLNTSGNDRRYREKALELAMRAFPPRRRPSATSELKEAAK